MDGESAWVGVRGRPGYGYDGEVGADEVGEMVVVEVEVMLDDVEEQTELRGEVECAECGW